MVKCKDYTYSMYMQFHKRLYEKYGTRLDISKIDAAKYLAQSHNIPKPLRMVVIEEMIHCGMALRINRHTIRVMPLRKDPVAQAGRKLVELGLF